MANWTGCILTTKGRALSAKVEAGKTLLKLTKMKVGDGQPTSLEALTDLASPKQVISLTGCEARSTGTCTVTGVLTNSDVSAGYYLRELGLYATDPDDGEILYAVTTDANPDYWQAKDSATALSIALTMTIAISSADKVSATIDPSGLVTAKMLEAHASSETAHSNRLWVSATADKPSSMADKGLWVELLD